MKGSHCLQEAEEERCKKEEERGRKEEGEEENELERRKKDEEEKCRKEEDDRSNSYIEISLHEKIDYYHPIVICNTHSNLNYCHNVCKELLVSNDRKYLFYCKLHLGI